MDLIILFGISFLVLVFLILGYIIGRLMERRLAEDREQEARADAVKRSRSVLTGNFSEQLAPYLPNFPYSPTEVRFIGSPVDFIVFEGMDSKEIGRVIFVEVKSGKSELSGQERKLKDSIERGKVSWELYRAP